MSNLQDVSLPSNEIVAETGAGVSSEEQKVKTNTLKRIFKLGKKPTTLADQSDVDMAAAMSENVNGHAEQAVPEEVQLPQLPADGKDYKTSTLGRFIQRIKGKSVAKESSPATGSGTTLDEADKPIPAAKPTLKASLSSYWRTIFVKRRQEGVAEQQDGSTGMADVELPNAMEQPSAAATAAAAAAAGVVAAHKLGSARGMPEVMDELQVLAMSEEVDVLEQSHD